MFPIYALFTLYTFFYVKKVSSTIILFQRHFFFGNPDKLISYYIDIKKLQRNYLYSFNLWRASNTINKNDGVTQKTAYTLVWKILYRLFSMWNRLEKCRNVLFHRIVEKILFYCISQNVNIFKLNQIFQYTMAKNVNSESLLCMMFKNKFPSYFT